jgi:hypothetical protein
MDQPAPKKSRERGPGVQRFAIRRANYHSPNDTHFDLYNPNSERGITVPYFAKLGITRSPNNYLAP